MIRTNKIRVLIQFLWCGQPNSGKKSLISSYPTGKPMTYYVKVLFETNFLYGTSVKILWTTIFLTQHIITRMQVTTTDNCNLPRVRDCDSIYWRVLGSPMSATMNTFCSLLFIFLVHRNHF